MLFIQYMGSIDLTTEQNSEDLYQEASSILDLDPGFYKVYELSSLMLSAKTPERAIELLERGQKTHKNKNDWRLFSMAGNIRHQETFFNKNVNKKEKLRDAIRFYREALKLPGVMPVLEKTYIKTRAQEVHETDPNKPLIIAKLVEWQKHISQKSVGAEYGADMEDESFVTIDENTKREILGIIQRIKTEHKDDLEGKETSQKLLQSIFKDIKVCQHCYVEFSAGHKFCVSCSKAVKTYGVCPNKQCGKVHSNGKFCEHCGTKLGGGGKK